MDGKRKSVSTQCRKSREDLGRRDQEGGGDGCGGKDGGGNQKGGEGESAEERGGVGAGRALVVDCP